MNIDNLVDKSIDDIVSFNILLKLMDSEENRKKIYDRIKDDNDKYRKLYLYYLLNERKWENIFKTTEYLDEPFYYNVLGLVCDINGDRDKANQYFKKAGDMGCGDGYSNLGYNYEFGFGDIDYSEAAKLYEKAGELGCGHGYFRLGSILATGKLMPKNRKLANIYYKMAGELGYYDGYYILALNYECGIGVETANLDEALKYYLMSIDLGSNPSYFTRHQLKLMEYYKKIQSMAASIEEKDKYMNKLIAEGKIDVAEGLVSQYL